MSKQDYEEKYKIVLLGSGGVGKSSITLQLVSGEYKKTYDPTIEETYQKVISVDGKIVLLDILDTAGQEEYSAMRDTYLREGEAFIFVYSVTDVSSLEELTKLYEQMIRSKECEEADEEETPAVICGNKCDLNDERVLSLEEGKEVLTEMGEYTDFFECSAKNRTNIEEVFQSIVRLIRMRKNGENFNPVFKEKEEIVAVEDKKQKKKKRRKNCIIN